VLQAFPAQVGQAVLLPPSPTLLSFQGASGNNLAFIGPAPLPSVSENGSIPLESNIGGPATLRGFLVTPNGGGGMDEELPMPAEEPEAAPLPPLGMDGAEPVLDFQPGAVGDSAPRPGSLLGSDAFDGDGMPGWAVLLLAISGLAGSYLAVPHRERERPEEGLLVGATRIGGWPPLA
jgi:hypothetical protein